MFSRSVTAVITGINCNYTFLKITLIKVGMRSLFEEKSVFK